MANNMADAITQVLAITAAKQAHKSGCMCKKCKGHRMAAVKVPGKITTKNKMKGAEANTVVPIQARKFSTKTRKKLAKTGVAEPDGSYPIKNAKDLSNAKKDFNRAHGTPADAAHIRKRAKALGLTAGGPGSGRHSSFGQYKKASESRNGYGDKITRYATNIDKPSSGSYHIKVADRSHGDFNEETDHPISITRRYDNGMDESSLGEIKHFTKDEAANELKNRYGIAHKF